MIPIEYFWIALILVFGIIGAARGLQKELGATTILLLSLFALWLAWHQANKMIVTTLQRGPLDELPKDAIMAVYYCVAIVFIAFISYEGIVLQFPVKRPARALQGPVGFLGGLLNGYLVVGTIWDVLARADYFRPTITVIVCELTKLHNTIAGYLPITLMQKLSPFILLALGMILLLAIVLK